MTCDYKGAGLAELIPWVTENYFDQSQGELILIQHCFSSKNGLKRWKLKIWGN